MANHKSALKRIRSNEKRRVLNRYQHKTTRNAIKALRLATDKVDVFHYGEQAEGQTITTGQPFLLFFETEQELIEELGFYGKTYDV